MPDMPAQAGVVVIGGGIVGCSVAYHLVLRGVTDVVVLARHELTSGTTWHAAVLGGQLWATKNLTQLAQYTSDLFKSLEEETSQATGFQQRGSVSVASTSERYEELQRGASMARLFGLDVETLSPQDVKELGWELYMPTKFMADVFDHIQSAGSHYGLRMAGYHALISLRMEKGYRHWGHDITPDDSPLQAGLAFAVAWDKPHGFIGGARLVRGREEGVARRLVQFKLPDSDRWMYHNEPIWRDDKVVGYITSGMYGHIVGAPLGMGYVENGEGLADQEFVTSGHYEVEVARDRIPAEASIKPFYDPASQRVRM